MKRSAGLYMQDSTENLATCQCSSGWVPGAWHLIDAQGYCETVCSAMLSLVPCRWTLLQWC